MVAHMVPVLSEEKLLHLKSRAEAAFYRACRDQLEPDVVVIHSVPWISTERGSKPRNGETDFTIFNPRKGFLVVEVKGGGISFSPGTGQWYSIDELGIKHELDEDPFLQALREEKATLEQIKSSAKWRAIGSPFLPGGHAVCFPDVSDLQTFYELSNVRKEILGGRFSLKNLAAWIDAVYDFWGGNNSGRMALPSDWMNIVEDLYCKDREIKPWLSVKLAEQEQTRIRLTAEQANRLRILGRRNRAAICGGAGTGKTLLAVEKARQLARDGHKTLLVCYNQLLGDEFLKLRDEFPNLEAMNFHKLCYVFAERALNECHHNVIEDAKSEYPNDDEYDVQLPYALMLAVLDLVDDRFDAIVVDEGQDFHDDYWTALDFLLRDPKESCLFIFFDGNQALYKRSAKFPIKDEPYPLYKNCRNTKQIHEAAYLYYIGDPVEPPIENIGLEIGQVTAPSEIEQARNMATRIRDLISQDRGLRGDDFVVLIGDNYYKSRYYQELKNFEKLLPVGFGFAFEERTGKKQIMVDTVHRFKGLEANIVFFWGIDSLNIGHDRETFYVAMSRAKSILVLVGTENACKDALSPQNMG